MPAEAQKEQKEFIVTEVQAVGHLLWLTMCRINFFKERESWRNATILGNKQKKLQ